jgi:hypothetical protein
MASIISYCKFFKYSCQFFCQGITHASQNLLSYVDVDSTIDDFIQYFINDFLPYIPTDALTDKRKLLKISKEFYQSKGTEKSYKFLFRVLHLK